MPYITNVAKVNLGLVMPRPLFPGELNYCFTAIIKNYLEEIKSLEQKDKISYTMINDVLGALEGAKLEFYRRVVVPYEDQKIKENGDVY